MIDGEGFRAFKNDETLVFTPRAFDVLLLLLEHSGKIVEKAEIFEAVWKDTFVTDNALTKVMTEIRQTLGDSASAPIYIETVPKRGYRFIGDIHEPDRSADLLGENDPTTSRESYLAPIDRRPWVRSRFTLAVLAVGMLAVLILFILYFGGTSPGPPKDAHSRTLAVLPFKPLNTESRDESLEMGMAEALISRLTTVKEIVVRPLNVVRKFTDTAQDPVKVGQELQADVVLDGSIQKAADRLRVTVRLIDVKAGAPIWSEQFDENYLDIFNVQDSIAERVTSALKLQLSKLEKDRLSKHETENVDAYEFYLRGQLLWNARRSNWINESLAYYQRALEKDPQYAPAHVGVADAYIMLSGHRRITMAEAEAKAEPHIRRALEIDDMSAHAHNALAELMYQYKYEWVGAETEFKKSLAINPNLTWTHQAYGWFLMGQGRFEEAEQHMDKARELDPASMTVNVGTGSLYYFSRRYDKAIEHFQNILGMEPNDSTSYFLLSAAYEKKGMYEEALDAHLRGLGQDESDLKDRIRKVYSQDGWTGFLKMRLKEVEERAKLGRLSPNLAASLCARLGRKDDAFAWINKAFESRDPSILQLKIDPDYDSLRDDLRYPALLKRIGLDP